ncbi:MAG: hypothetical protein ACFN4N_05795, partial [Streptococcus sp.]
SDIEITPRGVVVKMKLDEKTQIPSDSIFSLGSDGFLGDKFIQKWRSNEKDRTSPFDSTNDSK